MLTSKGSGKGVQNDYVCSMVPSGRVGYVGSASNE